MFKNLLEYSFNINYILKNLLEDSYYYKLKNKYLIKN